LPRYAVIVLSLIVVAFVAAALGIFVARSVATGLDHHRAIAINCPPSAQTSGGSGPGC
jgi:hypothetical protein